MRNLTLRLIKTYTVYETKESITINLDDYPETSDMSELEAKEWIEENLWSIPANDSDFYNSLGEELDDKDETDTKEIDPEWEVDFLDDTDEFNDFFNDEDEERDDYDYEN